MTYWNVEEVIFRRNLSPRLCCVVWQFYDRAHARMHVADVRNGHCACKRSFAIMYTSLMIRNETRKKT